MLSCISFVPVCVVSNLLAPNAWISLLGDDLLSWLMHSLLLCLSFVPVCVVIRLLLMPDFSCGYARANLFVASMKLWHIVSAVGGMLLYISKCSGSSTKYPCPYHRGGLIVVLKCAMMMMSYFTYKSDMLTSLLFPSPPPFFSPLGCWQYHRKGQSSSVCVCVSFGSVLWDHSSQIFGAYGWDFVDSVSAKV